GIYLLLLNKKRLRPDLSVATGTWIGLAILTDYMTLFIVPVIWIVWFLDEKLRKKWKYFLLMNLPLILTCLIILPLFAQQFNNAMGVRESGSMWWNILGSFSIKNILLVPIKFIIGRISFESNFIYGLYAGLALLMFGIALFHTKKKWSKNIALYLWLIIPLLMSITLALYIPVLYYFRLLYLLPALYILIAIGITKIGKKHYASLITAILAINIVSTGIYLF